ncbi:MAG: Gfo/Idh/MocA family oxidoreductase [Clostridia bacterium]|nr:Gfo/Idh/MocA family oxidoreductase [Clostridia bacterium]
MFRVGFLGSENSHATVFASMFNGYHKDVVGEFDDIQAVATYSAYPGVDQKLKDKYGVEFIAEKPEDMLGKVDAIIVTARDGKYHVPYARAFIEAGIPAFIDKPFAVDEDEAIELARLARDKGVPLCGGSSLKLCPETRAAITFMEKNREHVLGGFVKAPVSMHNEYGGFHFYSAHLAEMVLPVFGYYPQWVSASENPHGVSVIVHYDEYDVVCLYTDGRWDYEINISTAEELDQEKRDNPQFRQLVSLDLCYHEEARCIARMLRTGAMEHTYEELIQPVMFLAAVDRAMKSGQRETVRIAEL